MTRAVEFDRVSIVFGDNPEAALPLMDAGRERGEIQAETGQERRRKPPLSEKTSQCLL